MSSFVKPFLVTVILLYIISSTYALLCYECSTWKGDSSCLGDVEAESWIGKECGEPYPKPPAFRRAPYPCAHFSFTESKNG